LNDATFSNLAIDVIVGSLGIKLTSTVERNKVLHEAPNMHGKTSDKLPFTLPIHSVSRPGKAGPVQGARAA
jgi:hypothetical protein